MDRKEYIDQLGENAFPSINIMGVGGAGCRVVEYMMASGLRDAEWVIVDADAQMLQQSPCSKAVLIGEYTRPRPFCTAPPEWGRKAAMDDAHMIKKTLEGSDLVFLVAGMGGGIGTGAIPVIARICKEMGALTIAVITRPFPFEGEKRITKARKGIEEIKGVADITVLIPYDRLLAMISPRITLKEAYEKADEIIDYSVKGVAELLRNGEQAMLDGDFEYLKPFLADSGQAFMGIGIAEQLSQAMEKAISCPLLEGDPLDKAEKVLLNITPAEWTNLSEINVALDLLQERLGENTDILWGLTGIKNQPMITLYVTRLG